MFFPLKCRHCFCGNSRRVEPARGLWLRRVKGLPMQPLPKAGPISVSCFQPEQTVPPKPLMLNWCRDHPWGSGPLWRPGSLGQKQVRRKWSLGFDTMAAPETTWVLSLVINKVSLCQTWHSFLGLAWLLSMWQTELAMGNQEPRLYGWKFGSWPNWEAVCLGVLLLSSLFNILSPPFLKLYTPSKLAPLLLSAALDKDQGWKDLINSNKFGANVNLRCHSPQMNFYFIGDSKRL